MKTLSEYINESLMKINSDEDLSNVVDAIDDIVKLALDNVNENNNKSDEDSKLHTEFDKKVKALFDDVKSGIKKKNIRSKAWDIDNYKKFIKTTKDHNTSLPKYFAILSTYEYNKEDIYHIMYCAQDSKKCGYVHIGLGKDSDSVSLRVSSDKKLIQYTQEEKVLKETGWMLPISNELFDSLLSKNKIPTD